MVLPLMLVSSYAYLSNSSLKASTVFLPARSFSISFIFLLLNLLLKNVLSFAFSVKAVIRFLAYFLGSAFFKDLSLRTSSYIFTSSSPSFSLPSLSTPETLYLIDLNLSINILSTSLVTLISFFLPLII